MARGDLGERSPHWLQLVMLPGVGLRGVERARARWAIGRPAAPFVISCGDGGNRRSMNQWLWPLPAAGPSRFVAERPQYGIGESPAVIDATAIHAAANGAVQLGVDEGAVGPHASDTNGQ